MKKIFICPICGQKEKWHSHKKYCKVCSDIKRLGYNKSYNERKKNEI